MIAVTKKHDQVFVAGMTVLMLGTWLGFLVHRSPRFPGSPLGATVGIAAALLMLVPLAYMIVKRVRVLKRVVVPHFGMGTFLTVHIYAGIVGPILALVHGGHKFDSVAGIVLTAATLIVAVSGFIGRYLSSHVSRGLREKKVLRVDLEQQLGLLTSDRPPDDDEVTRLLPLAAEAMADVEYAVKTHERFKQWFSAWLRIHIVISLGLYGLLGLHVWAAFHFSARWYGGGAG